MKLITSQGGRLLTLGTVRDEARAWPLLEASPDAPVFSSGLPALDVLSPGGTLRRGAVHEVLSQPADGVPLFFAMLLARAAGGAIAWCDPAGELYPPALAGHGVDLDRLFLIQPPSAAEMIWTVGECLKCRGLGAVVAEVKASQRLTRVEARRLQLSAERGGGVGLLLRTAGRAAAEHAAATRWLVRPAPGERTVQRWEVQLVHGHGGRVGQAVILEHRRDTNRVRAIEKLVNQRRRTPLDAESA